MSTNRIRSLVRSAAALSVAVTAVAASSSAQDAPKPPHVPPPAVDPDGFKPAWVPPVKPPRPAAVGVVRTRSGQAAVGAAKAVTEADDPGLRFGGPRGVTFATADEHELWAAGETYKIGFSADGAEFVPALGSDAPRNFGLAMRVASVTVGGEPLALDAATRPRRSGVTVDLPRGGAIARYHVRPTGVEQTVVFESLPTQGEIVVRIATTSELEPQLRADGSISFRGPYAGGGLDYGAAIAVDAVGATTTVTTALDGDAIVHRIPAAFVASARLPLVLDPVISTYTTTVYPQDEIAPDVAYGERERDFLVVHERVYSQADSDVWAELRTRGGTPFPTSGRWIDLSSASWKAPRVAFNTIANGFLVVAQTAVNSGSAWAIRGKIYDAFNRTVGSAIDISGSENGDKVRPDVGGDANPVGPTYWNVVWQRDLSNGDRDIHYRLVRSSGQPVGTTVQVLANTSAFDESPRISTSCGRTGSRSQDWAVVWNREFLPTDREIYGAIVHWNGNVTTPEFVINQSSYDDVDPAVSSITDQLDGGVRRFVVSYASEQLDGSYAIVAEVLHPDGVHSGFTSVNSQRTPGSYGSQSQPAVDCDGCRFTIAWTEEYAPNPSDLDTKVKTYVLQGTTGLLTADPVTNLGNSTTDETQPALASERSGGGTHLFYLLAWADDRSSTNGSDIEGARYYGVDPTGGLRVAQVGCGGLQIQAGGNPQPGSTLTAELTSVQGPSGLIFGVPLATGVSCGSCLLYVQGETVLSPFAVEVPCDGSLLGVEVAAQGYDLLGGDCFGTIRLSDTAIWQLQ